MDADASMASMGRDNWSRMFRFLVQPLCDTKCKWVGWAWKLKMLKVRATACREEVYLLCITKFNVCERSEAGCVWEGRRDCVECNLAWHGTSCLTRANTAPPIMIAVTREMMYRATDTNDRVYLYLLSLSSYPFPTGNKTP
jgi:hypothetical protein